MLFLNTHTYTHTHTHARTHGPAHKRQKKQIIFDFYLIQK